MFLALSTLIYEWRRFTPAVFAVAFAGVLVVCQIALLLGMFSTVSVYIDESSADLWVGFPGTKSVDLARSIPARVESRLRLHPAVTRVEPFQWAIGDWRRPDGAAVSAYIIGLDPHTEGMAFAHTLTAEQRARLDWPDSVLVDETDLEKLGIEPGEPTEINGRAVTVAGTVRGLRAMGGANILTSNATIRRLDPTLRSGDNVAYHLVRLRDPALAAEVRDALQPIGTSSAFQVWTAEEFSRRSQSYWLFETGAGAGFAFGSFMGLLVGVVITSQTLVGAIVASIREYATLRALGVPFGALRRIVLAQSLCVGLAGLTVTALATAAALWVARLYSVAFVVTPSAAIGSAVFVLTVAALSGVLALRALRQAEPATLLR